MWPWIGLGLVMYGLYLFFVPIAANWIYPQFGMPKEWRRYLRNVVVFPAVSVFGPLSRFQDWKRARARRKKEAADREKWNKFTAKCMIAFGFNPQTSLSRDSVVLQWWIHKELERSRAAMEVAFRAQEKARHADPPEDTNMIDEIVRGVKQRDRDLYDLARDLLGSTAVLVKPSPAAQQAS